MCLFEIRDKSKISTAMPGGGTKFFDFEDKEECYYGEEEEVKKPRRPGEAPDGGWGWCVVLGAMLCSMVVVGLQSSYTEVQPHLEVYYDVPSSSARGSGRPEGASSSLSHIQVLLEAFSLIAGETSHISCDYLFISI